MFWARQPRPVLVAGVLTVRVALIPTICTWWLKQSILVAVNSIK